MFVSTSTRPPSNNSSAIPRGHSSRRVQSDYTSSTPLSAVASELYSSSASLAVSRRSTSIPLGGGVNSPSALRLSMVANAPDLDCRRVSTYIRVRPFIDEDGSDAICTRLQLAPSRQTVVVLAPTVSLGWEGALSRGGDQGNSRITDTEIAAAKRFVLDGVYGGETSQAEVYRACASASVVEVLSGIHAVVAVYGQTGSGKTFTVFGPDTDAIRVGAQDASLLGLIPRAMHDLFERIGVRSSALSNSTGLRYRVRVRYVQLYQDTWVDLLGDSAPGAAGKWLDPKFVPEKAAMHDCDSVKQVLALLQRGCRRKVVAATAMNSHSSRGHTVFQATVTRFVRDTEGGGNNESNLREVGSANLTFVDLAGSERLSRTHADGVLLTEARFINKSLHTLGLCMAALAASALRKMAVADGSDDIPSGPAPSFIPWRSSKLTRFLQSCLAEPEAGLSRASANSCSPATLSLITCTSPTDASTPETLSSLVFASRARAVSEALSGNAQAARTLLQDSTYYAPRHESEMLGRSAQQDGETSGAERRSSSNLLSGRPLQAPAEIDAVMDAQRTQIGALQAQYASLHSEYDSLRQQLLAEQAARAAQEEERATRERAASLSIQSESRARTAAVAAAEAEMRVRTEAMQQEVRAQAAEAIRQQQAVLLAELSAVQEAYDEQLRAEDTHDARRHRLRRTHSHSRRSSLSSIAEVVVDPVVAARDAEVTALRAQLAAAQAAADEARAQAVRLASESDKARENERWTSHVAISALANLTSAGSGSIMGVAPSVSVSDHALSRSSIALETLLAGALASGDHAALVAAVEGAASYVELQRSGPVIDREPVVQFHAKDVSAGGKSVNAADHSRGPLRRRTILGSPDSLDAGTAMSLTPSSVLVSPRMHNVDGDGIAAQDSLAEPLMISETVLEPDPREKEAVVGYPSKSQPPNHVLTLNDLCDLPFSPFGNGTALASRTDGISPTSNHLSIPLSTDEKVVIAHHAPILEPELLGGAIGHSDKKTDSDSYFASVAAQVDAILSAVPTTVPTAPVQVLTSVQSSAQSLDVDRDEALLALQAALERAQHVVTRLSTRNGAVQHNSVAGGVGWLNRAGSGGGTAGVRSRSGSIVSIPGSGRTSPVRALPSTAPGHSGSGMQQAPSLTAPWQPHVPHAPGPLSRPASPQDKPRPAHGPMGEVAPFARVAVIARESTPGLVISPSLDSDMPAQVLERPVPQRPASIPPPHAVESGESAIQPVQFPLRRTPMPPTTARRPSAVPVPLLVGVGAFNAVPSAPLPSVSDHVSAPAESVTPFTPLPTIPVRAAMEIAVDIDSSVRTHQLPLGEESGREGLAARAALNLQVLSEGEDAMHASPPPPARPQLLSPVQRRTIVTSEAESTSSNSLIVSDSSPDKSGQKISPVFDLQESIAATTCAEVEARHVPSAASWASSTSAAVEQSMRMSSGVSSESLSPAGSLGKACPTPRRASSQARPAVLVRPLAPSTLTPSLRMRTGSVSLAILPRHTARSPQPSPTHQVVRATHSPKWNREAFSVGKTSPLRMRALVMPHVSPGIGLHSSASVHEGETVDADDELSRAILSTRNALSKALTAVREVYKEGVGEEIIAPSSARAVEVALPPDPLPDASSSSLAASAFDGRISDLLHMVAGMGSPTAKSVLASGRSVTNQAFPVATDSHIPHTSPVASPASPSSNAVDASSRLSLYRSFLSELGARSADVIMQEARVKAAAMWAKGPAIPLLPPVQAIASPAVTAVAPAVALPMLVSALPPVSVPATARTGRSGFGTITVRVADMVPPPRQPTPTGQDKPDPPRGPTDDTNDIKKNVVLPPPPPPPSSSRRRGRVPSDTSVGHAGASSTPVRTGHSEQVMVTIPVQASPRTGQGPGPIPVLLPGRGVVLMSHDILSQMGVRVDSDPRARTHVLMAQGENVVARALSSRRNSGSSSSPTPMPTVTLATVGKFTGRVGH